MTPDMLTNAEREILRHVRWQAGDACADRLERALTTARQDLHDSRTLALRYLAERDRCLAERDEALQEMATMRPVDDHDEALALERDRMRAALRRGYDESGWCALCETHGDPGCPVCGEGQDGR
jgi:hypothetical protein